MRIIAGRWRGRIIDAPPGRKTRPTSDRVREAWMSAMQTEIATAEGLVRSYEACTRSCRPGPPVRRHTARR